ncbi:hypothetical protein RI129_005111 [Pyrocoelia pectoralis]|uniref:SCP domain-containing protein n=1 Tax=Pyrocoelia pectoralis TaxID=417401 RepID=A0AAN7VF52_9COLE
MFPGRVKLLLLALITMTFVNHTFEAWRSDRQPKVMGDKIPNSALLPNRKPLQNKIVLYHNYFRTRVVPRAANMLRMKWNHEVARSAQRWAETCMLLTHDDVAGRFIDNYGSCGQNIFVSSHQVPWLFAIKTWWLEKDNFTFGGDNNDLYVIGHYTQLVWATTHQVGCGFTKCDRVGNNKGRAYYSYVCNYCPIGNHPEKLGTPYKRGKPCAMCKRKCHAKKLCTNACPVADYWANCRELHAAWPNWLCDRSTGRGEERTEYCQATCKCKGTIYQ